MGMQLNQGDDLNSEINITPFVDVVLVLLVIFMVTTPLMQKAAELELPKTTLTKAVDGTEQMLTIDEYGHLKLGSKTVRYVDLLETLKNDKRAQDGGVINIAAHSSLPYVYVFRAMEAAQNAGISRVLLAGQDGDVKDLKTLDSEADKRRK